MSKTKEIKRQLQSQKKESKEYQVPLKPRRVIDQAYLKPQAVVPFKLNSLVVFVVFAFTLAIYIFTQARTMSFWDSGEYATCASIMGVPHPPGNPFYVVFGRAIMAIFGGFIPHGILAAFISGLSSALAVMFTYLFTVKLVSMLKVKPWEAILAGVVAGLYTAFSFTFWMNAVEAEVYSGLVFFLNIIIWLTLVWVEKSEDFSHQYILLFIIYLFFVGFSVHQTALQIAPAVLFIVCYPLLIGSYKRDSFWIKVVGYTVAILAGYFIAGGIGEKVGVDDFDKWGFALITIIILAIELREVFGKRFWALAILFVILGISSHLFLMIRAQDRPFINEGHPATLEAFKDYVLRKQYGNTSFVIRRATFFKEQMGYHFLRYLYDQWFQEGLLAPLVRSTGIIATSVSALFITVIGAIGGWFQAKRNRHSFFYFGIILLFTSIIMVFVINLSNQEVRDRDYFFVAAYNMWAVWMGIGAMALCNLLKGKYAKVIVAALMLLLPLGNMLSQYHVHDRSKEFIALDYGVNFLNSLEENAIIFTNGDNDTFPLWYAQAVYDPYAKEHVYPATDIAPSEEALAAIERAMEFKNRELKGIRKDVSVANLSLLNTPWYIKQLRDREGIQFGFTDEMIDALRISRLQKHLPVAGTEAALGFTLELDPVPNWRQGENFYRVADLAVMQIIKENFGHRPIYFAVTCENYVGFEDYTQNEGMVARVVSTPEPERVNGPRLIQNLDEIYEYRSIEDEKVFKDDNMMRLVMNYGAGFVRAATYLAEKGDYDKARGYIQRAKVFIADEIRLTDFYTKFYSGINDWNELDHFLENVVFKHPQGWSIYLRMVMPYLEENHSSVVLRYLEKGMLAYPSQEYFAKSALHYAISTDKYNEIKDLLLRLESRVSYQLAPYISDLNMMISEQN